jgi:L-rhamnose-H+ transport protein
MGVLWGIGGLTFGLAMRYLGISLGMSVALGFCSAFGALIPPIYRDMGGVDGLKLTAMISNPGGRLVLLGVVVCLFGIAICGRAGMLKERELSAEQKKVGVKEFNFPLGLVVAIFSGILSACFNFGIEAGQPMADLAVQRGDNPLFQTNVTYVVLLWGGLTTNLIWCIVLNARNRSFGDYVDRQTPLANNYLFAAIAGATWYLQFFFYGMGASKLTNGPSSWILHMAFIIIVSNLWGIVFDEWKGVARRTLATQLLGIAIILASVALVGYGNSLLGA